MAIPAIQAEVAAFLQRATGGGAPVETHISAIFLGPEEALKLRKAVKLGFLDFTSLAERERTARREYDLNAPHAPGMYRAVEPVVRGPAGLALGGDGDVVDWVVRMARVPAQDFLEHAMPGDALLRDIADMVAAMHAALPPAHPGQAGAFRRITIGNAASARAVGIDPEPWLAAMLAWLDTHGPWLRAREAAGFVRRCHGDLHLGNLCLWRGSPVAFDALEFDEALATLDVGYDLAFLLMDLDVRIGRAQANLVLNRYLARSADFGLLAGLPFFLAQRAMVLAHVRAARGLENDAYLRRARAYLAPVPPRVVAIGGLPGSGKSTLARMLAPRLGMAPGALVLRSDEVRKRQHGVAPEVRLPPAAYAPQASDAVLAELAAAVRAAVAGGHSVIVDATFMAPGWRDAVAAAAGGAVFAGVWLDAPADVLRARVAARTGDASDADLAVLETALASGAGAGAWRTLDATDLAAALALLSP